METGQCVQPLTPGHFKEAGMVSIQGIAFFRKKRVKLEQYNFIRKSMEMFFI
jgi:hypothetical protein